MAPTTLQKPWLLVSIGLLGISLYALVVRIAHPPILENDFLRGLWYGLCLGLEILGAYRIAREKRKTNSGREG